MRGWSRDAGGPCRRPGGRDCDAGYWTHPDGVGVLRYATAVSTHVRMDVNHQAANSPEMEAQLPRFLITRSCLLLAFASSCSWQSIISRCEHVRSSAARVGQGVCLCLFGHLYPCQHRNTGGLCLVVELGDAAPGLLLVEELLAWKEPVHDEVESLVQPV